MKNSLINDQIIEMNLLFFGEIIEYFTFDIFDYLKQILSSQSRIMKNFFIFDYFSFNALPLVKSTLFNFIKRRFFSINIRFKSLQRTFSRKKSIETVQLLMKISIGSIFDQVHSKLQIQFDTFDQILVEKDMLE